MNRWATASDPVILSSMTSPAMVKKTENISIKKIGNVRVLEAVKACTKAQNRQTKPGSIRYGEEAMDHCNALQIYKKIDYKNL